MSKFDYDLAINALEDKICVTKECLTKKMRQKSRDRLKMYIAELRKAIKVLKDKEIECR